MSYRLHRLAERELESALDYYRQQGSERLALRFLLEFERVAELVLPHPELGTPTRLTRRRFPLRRFPYSIIYTVSATGLRILVLRHDRQAPELGLKRR